MDIFKRKIIMEEINQQNVSQIFIHFTPTDFYHKINFPFQDIIKHLVIKILSSKRLLIDHAEILEESAERAKIFDVVDSEYFTFVKTTGLLSVVSTVAIHFRSRSV